MGEGGLRRGEGGLQRDSAEGVGGGGQELLVNGAEGKWGGVKGQRKRRAPGGQEEGLLGWCGGSRERKQKEERGVTWAGEGGWGLGRSLGVEGKVKGLQGREGDCQGGLRRTG